MSKTNIFNEQELFQQYYVLEGMSYLSQSTTARFYRSDMLTSYDNIKPLESTLLPWLRSSLE